MTLNDLFNRFYTLNQEAYSLLLDTRFLDSDRLALSPCQTGDAAQDAFLHSLAVTLLESLSQFHDLLDYLQKPTHGEYILLPFKGGRYGYFDRNGKQHIFTCGKSLEAKLGESDLDACWVKTRIEHNGTDYFLWGYKGIPLSGLTVRERG